MKTNIVFIALGVLLSALVAGVGAQIISSNNNVQIGGSGGITSLFVPPLTPANGGVGAMTGAPMWTRYFGTGADGAGPASGTISGVKNFTTWTCTGAVQFSSGTYVLATGAVNLNTGCSITSLTGNVNPGDIGGAGGSGGSGAANSSASTATAPLGTTYTLSAAAAASSAGAGNSGGVINIPINIASLNLLGPPMLFRGGGPGTAGGSSGGAKGNGGFALFIMAPTITIANGVTISTAGFPGIDAAANSTGAGGGGGGGELTLAAETITDNGAIFQYGGGPGGGCTAPNIQATNGGCTTAGCGTGAVFTVTALVTGGLSAANITITNAGSGYQTAPTCQVNAGASGLVGSPACHFTISGNAIASVVIDTPGSGGTLSTFTTCFAGGYGANGWMKEHIIQ